jgi:phosphatidylserine/phosphatidylglycerophosphate/cardiolipin synthase-like enzyme
MTGSTNWTSTGLCGQSNNALVVTSDDVAGAYDDYWERLLADRFPSPRPPTAAGKARQVQGPKIRDAHQTPSDSTLNGSGKVEVWYSPNTTAVKKGTKTPPDLEVLFDLMSKAQEAMFFLAFLPSRAGADSIISAAVDAAKANKDLIVAGAISDVTAMPGYVAPNKKGRTKAEREGVKPYTFDQGGLHVVRAVALNDPIDNFEKEILKVGNAVVHDKIVVIDPLSENCVVATGSHNLGFKASYENDENLLIFRGTPALAQAYAVHIIDVYDHYRFRAWQARQRDEGKPTFEGHINGDDKWLRDTVKKKNRRNIATYFA